MGKYNVSINMSNRNSSHTLILEQIKPGSLVLEMGCATGYMTKYMKEKLGCCIDTVEYDVESIDQAKQYAHYAFCCDIDDNGWYGFYNNNRYDYVLFADVLEHLRDPLKALQRATELLRKDGKIIISIPNICHNDIIVQLFHNHFRYTDLGLLDSTHIHFWGLEDFADFVHDVGLKITGMRTVEFPTQGTEQRIPFRLDSELMNLLKKREYGEVYQYIFTCEKR